MNQTKQQQQQKEWSRINIEMKKKWFPIQVCGIHYHHHQTYLNDGQCVCVCLFDDYLLTIIIFVTINE